jgi:hypothetical protein
MNDRGDTRRASRELVTTSCRGSPLGRRPARRRIVIRGRKVRLARPGAGATLAVPRSKVEGVHALEAYRTGVRIGAGGDRRSRICVQLRDVGRQQQGDIATDGPKPACDRYRVELSRLSRPDSGPPRDARCGAALFSGDIPLRLCAGLPGPEIGLPLLQKRTHALHKIVRPPGLALEVAFQIKLRVEAVAE